MKLNKLRKINNTVIKSFNNSSNIYKSIFKSKEIEIFTTITTLNDDHYCYHNFI
jgi:hypothetical protein